MSRISTGLGFAAAIGLAATLSAQSPTTTASTAGKDHDVTVTGCLSKASAGFMLTNAHVDPNASSTTTTASGTSTTTGGTNPTAGTTGTSGAAAAAAMTWMVSGDNDLEKHVGHKIQVTGKTSWDEHSRSSATTAAPPASSTSTTGSTTTSSNAEPRLDVKSIKMVSTSCS